MQEDLAVATSRMYYIRMPYLKIFTGVEAKYKYSNIVLNTIQSLPS